MIIYVHMLKTAGTSFRNAIRETFGDGLLWDYDDIPMSNRPEHEIQRKARRDALQKQYTKINADIIYGHFIMDKYDGLISDLQYGTMFRDPVTRIVSHYFHYLRHIGWPRNEILPEGISIPEFSRLPRYCDMYKYLMGSKDVADLDYVGITEEFDKSLRLFSKVFGVSLPDVATPKPPSEYGDAVALLMERGIYTEVKRSQQPNNEIYARALDRFWQLVERYDVS